MEFLTTYGWAILILLIVIVALANLGVFKAKSSVNACIPIGPFSACDINLRTGVVVNGNEIAVTYNQDIVGAVNLRLTDINIKNAGVATCQATTGQATTTDMVSGTTYTFTCDVNPGAVGSTYTGDVTMQYASSSGLLKQVTMTVGGTILP